MTNAKPGEANQKSDALDKLYGEIVSRTDNQRRLNSLRNLYNTLRHLLSVKSNATSVAAIAGAVAALGFSVPKAQSIRNVEGKDFRDLISAYCAISDNGKSGEPSDDEKLIGGIDDLKIAAQVKWLLAENRSLKRRLDLLHSEFQKLQPMKLLGTLPVTENPASTEFLGFTKIEIDAVREFQANLSEIDCVIDEASGALLYRGKLEIAPPGFKQALVKLTENTKD
ncbi:hypothetical protein GFM02_33260 [Rhizobium leguminosarum bv. viciae]|uniref:gamma-mobile-trio protein GmtX n=1 Tax=Rhizobium leguminosarum TaxID=384 RepID=UPI0014417F2D|nr:gamma-mobile-trio protein GmtX [Rhizobium leguminosarum]NKL02972.1 hypothetical protein [Rhizobium leguminosarum bv. viciae]